MKQPFINSNLTSERRITLLSSHSFKFNRLRTVDVIQRHEGTITQQQRVITGYRDNPSRLIEGDVIGEESKEAMVIQLNQSRELAEGVTVILV